MGKGVGGRLTKSRLLPGSQSTALY